MSERLEVKVPCENVNDSTAKLLAWKVASGTAVKAGEIVAELENSKATFDVTAPHEGIVEHTRALGEEVPVGDTLFYLVSKSATPQAPALAAQTANAGRAAEPAPGSPMQPASPAPVTAATASTHAGSVPAFSRRAQELLGTLGIAPAVFNGAAFVRESDVQRKAIELGKLHDSTPSTAPAVRRPASSPAIQTPTARSEPQPTEAGEKVPLPRAKLLENRELIAMARSALNCTLNFSCPAGGLTQGCARQSPPVSRLAVLLYECVQVLKKFRYLNACYVEESAWLYEHVHLGFAVDMGRGLKVLVIKNAEILSFAEFSANIESLLVKYATNTLAVADVTGSTFTMTDLSQEGVQSFTPLINSSQSAILGVGAEDAGANGEPGSFLLSCTFDHRLMGGKLVAEFLSGLSGRLVAHRDSLLKSVSPEHQPHCSRCFQSVEKLRSLRAFLLPCEEPKGYICTNCLSGF